MPEPQLALDLDDLDGLDDRSRLPLYAQVADMFATRIRPAQAKLAGRALPSELETAAHFRISRPTVRQAMGQLLSEGLIERGRGKGTFVAPPHAGRDLGRAFEFDFIRGQGDHKFEFRLLARERVVAPPAVAAALRLAADEAVERVTRLRLRGGELVAFEERFMPLREARKISDAMLKHELGAVFARRLFNGGRGRVTFRVRAVPADARAARHLDLRKGAPVLASEHTFFAPRDAPVLHGFVFFRGDRYDFRFQAPLRGIRESKPARAGR